MAHALDLPSAPPPPPDPSTSTSIGRSSTIRASPAQQAAAGAQLKGMNGTRGGMRQDVLASTSRVTGSTATMTSTDDGLIALTLLPNPPLPTDLAQYLAETSPLSPEQKRVLFTAVYVRAASSGNADLLEWLVSLPHDPQLSTAENAANAKRFSLSRAKKRESQLSIASFAASEHDVGAGLGIDDDLPDWVARKWVDLDGQDAEGNPALVLAVAFGHSEAVRVLVESGAHINEADRAGWTALHWAAQNNDIPIAAYLLNHRASPLLVSRRGLTAKDLVRPGPEGLAMREVLSSAWEAAIERERALRRATEAALDGVGKGKGKAIQEEDQDSRSTTMSRSISRVSLAALSEVDASTASWEDDRERERAEAKEREAAQRRQWQLALDCAEILQLDLQLIGVRDPRARSGRDPPPQDVEEGDDEESAMPAQPSSFDWNHCLADQMLVFSLSDLPLLLDVVISFMRPAPIRKYRSTPANAIFLAARYAHYIGGTELFDELMFGVLERIENNIHRRPDDMAGCAFWLSNCLLILYYLRTEPNLAAATSDYQAHFADLTNEIYVFIIRDAERRIDRVLEAAVLEHEPLPGFEDVAFEDEWASTRFVKKLTGRAKKGAGMRSSTSAMSLFSDTGSVSSADGLGGASSPGRDRSTSTGNTPKDVTDILTATLFVLQLYELPPVVVIQAISQLFYWLACEIFNRLFSQRKYLCRSRAMQIRLNVSTLEDWARTNRLSTKMVSTHFAPVHQLLQWLQCLSSESSIDGLIGTVDTLRALNPTQLRRAVREYRYEVDESNINDDCVEYLAQVEKQWERRRLQQQDAGQPGVPANSLGESDDRNPAVDCVDAISGDPAALLRYVPPSTPEPSGELHNSRHMLPFALPTSTRHLVDGGKSELTGALASIKLSGGVSSNGRSESRSEARGVGSDSVTTSTNPGDSTSSGNSAQVPLVEDVADRLVPVLPDDFFAVLDVARRRAGRATGHSPSAALLADGDIRDAFKTPQLGSADPDAEGTSGRWWSGGSPARVSGMSPLAASRNGSARADRSASLSRGVGQDPDSSFESVGSVDDTPRPAFAFRF